MVRLFWFARSENFLKVVQNYQPEYPNGNVCTICFYLPVPGPAPVLLSSFVAAHSGILLIEPFSPGVNYGDM